MRPAGTKKASRSRQSRGRDQHERKLPKLIFKLTAMTAPRFPPKLPRDNAKASSEAPAITYLPEKEESPSVEPKRGRCPRALATLYFLAG